MQLQDQVLRAVGVIATDEDAAEDAEEPAESETDG
jgi:hypothetical protein